MAVEAGGVAVIRVLGLDLKPARSGIAQNYDPATGVEALTVTAVGKPGRPLHVQIREIERAVLHRVSAFRADVAFIEGTFSRPGGSGSDYGQHAVHFAATHILWAKGISWVDVAPGTLKVWATGSGALRGAGKVTKDRVIAGVIADYGRFMNIPAGDDDCADAVALLTMGCAAYGHPLCMVPKGQARALSSLVSKGLLPALPVR